ncbi:MAG: class I SAM-dependent methyltransferase [Candidatus Omnitrophica bacterium]|nr:class I SAM-dependent methyltransferase [Candidatus Omnitrophota bacterium]
MEKYCLDDEIKIKEQFSVRCPKFDISANWITDNALICAHADLAGKPKGEALELCCGTGQVGCALKTKGWAVKGLDICDSMVEVSSRYFPVLQGRVEKIPFETSRFPLVVCRQAFHFLNIQEALREIARVLAPRGVFVLSLTVPFSGEDSKWLYEIHRIKQPLLKKFYTTQDLIRALKEAKFSIIKIKNLKVRESVTRWMKYAPELTRQTREKVIAAVKNAPEPYKRLHNVEVRGKEVLEDWNWVILKTAFRKI